MKEKEEMRNYMQHRLFCVGFRELINSPNIMASTKLPKFEPLLADLEKIKARMADLTTVLSHISTNAGQKGYLMGIFEEVC